TPAYLRAELRGGRGDTSAVAHDALWWPPAKISGRYLAPFLATYADLDIETPDDLQGALTVEAVLAATPSRERRRGLRWSARRRGAVARQGPARPITAVGGSSAPPLGHKGVGVCAAPGIFLGSQAGGGGEARTLGGAVCWGCGVARLALGCLPPGTGWAHG